MLIENLKEILTNRTRLGKRKLGGHETARPAQILHVAPIARGRMSQSLISPGKTARPALAAQASLTEESIAYKGSDLRCLGFSAGLACRERPRHALLV